MRYNRFNLLVLYCPGHYANDESGAFQNEFLATPYQTSPLMMNVKGYFLQELANLLSDAHWMILTGETDVMKVIEVDEFL